MKKLKQFEFEVFDALIDLKEDQKHLLEKTTEHLESSYSPYSNFMVAAGLLLEDGRIVLGSNQENMAYPSGLCAERVAFFSARSQEPKLKILKVAITAKSNDYIVSNPITPCGACRQVMLEYELNQEQAIELIMKGESGPVIVVDRVKDLMPLHFFEKNLKDR